MEEQGFFVMEDGAKSCDVIVRKRCIVPEPRTREVMC